MKPEEQLQKAIALCQQGENYSKKNSYSIALQHFDKAEPLLTEIQNNEWLAFLKHQKFFCYLALEKMDEAQSSAQMAIEMYKKVDNEESLVSILINLIDFWNKKDNFQQALFYAKIAEAIVEKKKYSTSGLLYQKLAQLYNQQMFATKSIQYYTKAIETFAQLDDSNKSLCLYEKGLVFKSIFQFAHALDCLQGGLTIFIALKNNAYILKTLEQIRKIFLSQGESSKAKEIESKIVRLGQEAL